MKISHTFTHRSFLGGSRRAGRMDFPPHTSPCRERLVGLSTESNGNFLCPKLSYQGLKINFSSDSLFGDCLGDIMVML